MLRILLMLFALMLPAWAQALAAPHLVVDAPRYDFGTVMQGEKVEHNFSFRNAGDEPLLIDKVKSSCSCTASLVSSKEIPPGASGTIQAVFDSTRFHGRIHKTIFLYSNDPQQPNSEFLLEGEVLQPVQMVPSLLNFGVVGANEEKQMVLRVKNASSQPLQVVNARTSNPVIRVDWSAVELKPDEETTMTVTVQPAANMLSISGSVLIRTSFANGREFDVPVRGSVKRP